MKYLAKSADALNEADAFEKRLAWELFSLEQDRQLFGPSEIEWRPGDFLYDNDYSKRLQAYVDDNMIYSSLLGIRVGETVPAYYGNTVRYMAEYLEDGDQYPWVRCADCEVSWEGSSSCWMCGEDKPGQYESAFARELSINQATPRPMSNHTPGTAIDINAFDHDHENPIGVVMEDFDVVTFTERFNIDVETYRAMIGMSVHQAQSAFASMAAHLDAMTESLRNVQFNLPQARGHSSLFLPIFDEMSTEVVLNQGEILVVDDDGDEHVLQLPEELDLGTVSQEVPWVAEPVRPTLEEHPIRYSPFWVENNRRRN